MQGQAELVIIVNRLVSVGDANPTVKSILAVVPDFEHMDWINRFGPADAWATTVSALSTVQLERLFKILVIAEREFDWLGGSVAAPIWLFRAYSQRVDADADTLAEWALRNRGRNDYVPFGSMTSARSLEQWHAEQRARSVRRASQREREQEQEFAKHQRVARAEARSGERRQASEQRHVDLQGRLERLKSLDVSARLRALATDTELPLEFIPTDLIVDSLSVATSLDQATRKALLKRIDRRRGQHWESLRAALGGEANR